MRVLIVDDDEVFCRFLVELLEDVGVDAFSINDGVKAYECINQECYDLGIIDVRMPLIIGTELAEGLQALQPQLKIILASAFADRALRDYAKRRGLLLLSKPFTKLQLFDAVKLALGESIGKN
jgi:CheY-like chemotaxis protein